jgi:outer membrane immunogenic protein
MRRLLFALIAFVFAAPFSQMASAADMPIKAPVVPAAIPLSWTGFYAGLNVGYGWGRSGNDWNYFAPGIGGAPALQTICAPAGFAFCAIGSDSNKLKGVIGGAQLGYNWQWARYVAGLETDFQFSGQRGDAISRVINGTNGIAFGIPVTGTVTGTYTEKITWLGTLRGRVGYTFDPVLLYVTGGLAYGRITTIGSATALGSNVGPGCVPLQPLGAQCPLATWDKGVTKAGWTVGAGAEGVITGNWSWKVEYLHVDLGKTGTTFPTLPGCYGGIIIVGGGAAANCNLYPAGSGIIRSRITDEIVRVGVNYRFAAAGR